MASPRIVLPCVNTWSGLGEISRFLAALGPHWHATPEVVLDFSACGFLSAEGAVLLATFKLRRRSDGRKTEIDWATVPSDVYKQLGRWKLTELFERECYPWTDNAIPLFHQAKLDPRQLVEYTCTWVQPGRNMPVMTGPLTKQVQKSFCELFLNVFHHAASPCGGVAIGQLYPNVKQVQICVCDAGSGMVQKIRRAGLTFPKPANALAWSLAEGTTTRNDPSGPPGGLGLFLLREFVKLNGGSLRIIANRGYLCQEAGNLTLETLSEEMPGTLFQFKFLIRDDVVYTLAPG
jgi:hypothetical protein